MPTEDWRRCEKRFGTQHCIHAKSGGDIITQEKFPNNRNISLNCQKVAGLAECNRNHPYASTYTTISNNAIIGVVGEEETAGNE